MRKSSLPENGRHGKLGPAGAEDGERVRRNLALAKNGVELFVRDFPVRNAEDAESQTTILIDVFNGYAVEFGWEAAVDDFRDVTTALSRKLYAGEYEEQIDRLQSIVDIRVERKR